MNDEQYRNICGFLDQIVTLLQKILEKLNNKAS